MKAALIVNPIAGQGRIEKNLSKIKNRLEIAGFDLIVYVTEHEGQATRLAERAVEEGIKTVIAAGGDGTVSEVINGLAKKNIKFGLIPAGTADVFAHEVGIPTHNPLKACDIIIDGKNKQIDLGKANDKYFVLMAGVGFDAQVVREVKPEAKRLLKDAVYSLTGIKTLLTYKPSLLEIEFDNCSTHGYFVVIGNARYYAGRFSVTREAKIDDGLLDVCVFTGKTVASFVKYVQGVITGGHLRFSDVSYYRAKEIKIVSDGPALVQADGEIIGKTPMKFSIAPRALEVLVP